ncbi:hypothetical protein IOK49_05680 [Fervidicoccus fontis]|uniref:Uncharacterized protein n=1 Tax=Fervidicoccus fontis TaxID=683846 RepID=A0A843AEJ4_9CREN|nr:hypothetical protein [Fervidicoccus fontis]MBE9391557.1 hypothetical protein [Fervidicoccus fontis]
MKKEKAIIEKWGKILYIKTETGKEALVPEEDLCNLIERFKLEVDGVKC